jgi:DNA polymerase-3 subunit beta
MLSIKCNRQEVLRTLERCGRVATKKSTAPITECLLLTAQDGGVLQADATDLVMSIQGTCAAELVSSGAVCINVASLIERIKLLPVDQFSLTETEAGKVVLKAIGQRRQYTIDAQPGDVFPEVKTAPHDAEKMTIQSKTTSGLIEAVSSAASLDTTRPNLNAAFLEWDGRTVRMTATDGRMLSTCTAKTDDPRHVKALIPLRGLLELCGLCDAADLLTLAVTASELFASSGSVRLALKLATSEFIPYQQVVSSVMSEAVHPVSVSAKSLGEALKGVSVATDNSVKFTFSLGKLTLEASGNNLGESIDELDIGYTGGPLSVSLDPKLLSYAIKAAGVEELTLRIGSNDLDAVVVQSSGDPDKSDYTGIIMPIRL